MAECPDAKWLLLVHQIPIKPAYFRVKIWRRLQSLGAVAIKNSVYIIPKSEETLEDFHWVLREIVQGGGDASICAANFVEGLTDEQVEAMFQTARDEDYAQIADAARSLLATVPVSPAAVTDEDRAGLETNISRLKKKLQSIFPLDFFGASGRETAETIVSELEVRLKEFRDKGETDKEFLETPDLVDLRGRTWVTRKGVFVDRIACAWLISRFIDPEAQFKFVSAKGYRPRTGELRFDMFEGEFTHKGDLCTFEVLVMNFFSADHALSEIGKIIHELDLKDSKFQKSETPGIRVLLEGLALANTSDEARLDRGRAMFDDLYEYFRRK